MTTQNHNTTVKSILIGCALILVSSFSAFAQIPGRFSAGIDIGVPIGGFSDFSSVGFGAYGKYEQAIKSVPKLNWTAQSGVTFFSGKNLDGYKVSTTAVPFLGGVRYYIDDRFAGFYVGADAGFTVFSEHASATNGNGFNNIYGSASTTRFTFAPGAGYHLANLDFGARFVLNSDFTYFNLRAAYVWGK